MGYGIWSLVIAGLLGIVLLDVVAMRRLAHQRAPLPPEGWDEYVRLAPVDPRLLNDTQRRLVQLGRQRQRATDADAARRLDEAMDDLVRRRRRDLT
jgi:hypothetical protein